MPNTSLSALPYPTLTSSNNPPADIQALATALDPLVTPQIQSFTVSWTQTGGTALNIGNGSLIGRYVKVGRKVTFQIELTRGSTTNLGTATYFWSLPVPALTLAQMPGVGNAVIAGGNRPFFIRMPTSTTVAGVRPDDSGLGSSSFSWATGDLIYMSGTYISAS